jgi:flagellin
LSIATENLAAANSRIRDADMALETSELTKQSILSQAGTSVLSQANTSQNLALKLL